MALQGFKNLAEQRQLLSCVDGLRSELQESAARVQSSECLVVVHSTDLTLARGDMTRLQESVTPARRQFADPQYELFTMEEECDEYRRQLGVEEQGCSSLEA